MNTKDVLGLMCKEVAAWNMAPAPKTGPLFVRSKGTNSVVIHDDNWLLDEIHGKDYEWAKVS